MFGGGGPAPPAGYGTIPGMSPMMTNPAFDNFDSADSFVGYFKRMGARAESDHYRLDLAKWILVSILVANNFIQPFVAAGSKLACVIHNTVSMFAVPSFILIGGYASAELTRRRRRYVVAFLIVPYLLLQCVYVSVYVALYWKASFRDHPGGKTMTRPNGELTNKWWGEDREI